MSPMAKMPGSLVSNFSVSTGIRFSCEIQPPVGDRPELHGEAEERQQPVALRRCASPSLVFTVTAASSPPSPCSAVIWPMQQGDLACPPPAARIFSTEWGAPRNSSRRCSSVRLLATGCRFSVQSSAESPPPTISTSLAAEVLHAPHGVEHRPALVGLDARERRPLGRERAAAGRDHHHLGEELGADVGHEPEAAVLQRCSASTRWPRWKVAPNGLICSSRRVGQLLAGHDRQARDVVDRLLRIELGALPAGLVQDVDDVRLDVDQAQLEHGEQPDRAAADDQRIGLDRGRAARFRRRPCDTLALRSIVRSELLLGHADDEAVQLRRHLDLAGQAARRGARRRRSPACPPPSR